MQRHTTTTAAITPASPSSGAARDIASSASGGCGGCPSAALGGRSRGPRGPGPGLTSDLRGGGWINIRGGSGVVVGSTSTGGGTPAIGMTNPSVGLKEILGIRDASTASSGLRRGGEGTEVGGIGGEGCGGGSTLGTGAGSMWIEMGGTLRTGAGSTTLGGISPAQPPMPLHLSPTVSGFSSLQGVPEPAKTI